MELLPKEMLFGIFEYLPASDLISLTAVCSAFDEAISNSKLVKKLLLSFRKLNGEDGSIGRRRYVQLQIGYFKPTYHFSILSDIGAQVVSLTFKNHKFKLDLIRRILVATSNVKTLKLERIRLSDVPNIMKQPFPELKQLSLTSNESDPRVYRVMMKCSLKDLRIRQSAQDNFSNFSDLIHLLQTQVHLKHFTLDGFCKTGLFSDDALDETNFQLESFSLKNSTFQRTVHLKSFVEFHTVTLNQFEMCNVALCDFSAVLNQSKQLKVLNISNVSLNYLETLETVEELAITGHKVVGKVLCKMPCVQRLKLKWMKDKRLLSIISDSMKDLECVEVTDGAIEGLNIPTMRMLTLCSVDQCPDDFFKINYGLEELRIENCSFISDRMVENIAESLLKLKSLTIMNSGKITNESLKAINDSCLALRNIKISRSGDNLDWKLLENSRDVKIYIS